MADLTARGAVPSSAIKANYQKSLTNLVEEMRDSVLYWMKARYRSREDEIVVETAEDRSASRDLEAELRALLRQWQKKFDVFAEMRSKLFARRVNANTTVQMVNALKDAGLTVKFKNSRRVNNMLQAIVAENVGLIKSIPQQFLGQVRSIVMTGVTNGRDMAYISKEIEERYKVSRNRAITIARDQTNKATEAISRARCSDIGITHGIWMHRSGSKVPRPEHVRFDGKRFELAKGLLDNTVGRYVKPGELVNCRCTFRLDLSSVSSTAMDGIRRGNKFILPAAVIEWGKTG